MALVEQILTKSKLDKKSLLSKNKWFKTHIATQNNITILKNDSTYPYDEHEHTTQRVRGNQCHTKLDAKIKRKKLKKNRWNQGVFKNHWCRIESAS